MISKNIDKAVRYLKANKLVSIPTETVYGLAGNAFNEEAIHAIFELKKRPFHNPLIVHISSLNELPKVAKFIPKKAQILAEHFWPGPLTLVLPKQDSISNLVTSGKSTVAVRVPNHSLTLALLRQVGFPLVAPSANPFTSISPTTPQHVYNYFKDELKLILDGGVCQCGVESTIIGFEEDEPVVYRLGALPIEDIEQIIGKVKFVNPVDELTPEAPGMLFKHYAPRTKTYVIDVAKEDEFIDSNSPLKIAALRFQIPHPNIPLKHQEILAENGSLKDATKNLYAALHRLDALGLDLIIAQKFPEEGLGVTLNDKLKRASTQY